MHPSCASWWAAPRRWASPWRGCPTPVEFRAAADDGRIELQPVTLQELLGRPQITFDHAAVRGLVEGRRVLVTGAGGSIGGELVRQIASHRPGRLVLLDSCEFNLYTVDHEVATRFPEVDRTALLADVRVRERVRAIFEEHRPELVFHAAALKHVPMVELNPVEGALTNVVGTRNVADAAWACGALAMLQISTDKAVNPTSVMGATKRLAELYCQTLDRAAGQVRGPTARAAPPLHDGALRQRAGLVGLGRAALPQAARGRRSAYRHPPGHLPVLHDHTGGRRARAPGLRPSAWPRPANAAGCSCSTWASPSGSSTSPGT